MISTFSRLESKFFSTTWLTKKLLVSGHFCYSYAVYQAFRNQYSFITLLREPVSRWISSYFYNQYKKWNHRKIEMTIDEYADSKLGRSPSYEYVMFLARRNIASTSYTYEAVDQAKENLNKFDIVGLTEDQKAFKSKFADQFGNRLQIQYLNRSPKASSNQKNTVTDTLLKKVEEFYQPDTEIYEFSISLQ